MIEDIAPHRLNNQFQRRQPDADDWLIAVDGDQVLMSEGSEEFSPGSTAAAAAGAGISV